MIAAARNLLKKHPSAEWLIPLGFCLVLLAQMLFSVQQMSQQADESTHLYAGYRILKCGDYVFGREHPPLAKVLAAAPLLWGNPPMDCSPPARDILVDADRASRWLYSQDDWWRLLMRARIASSFFAAALCLGVWIVARRMFGLAAAVVSTVALVFEPNTLSQGALVLNNVLLSVLFLLAVFCFYLWSRQRSVPLLAGTGVLTGLALLTKHSAVLLIAVLALLAVASAWLEKSDKRQAAGRALGNVGAVVATLAIAAATIWIGYGVRPTGGSRVESDSTGQQQVPSTNTAGVQILEGARSAHLLPQPYLDGLIDIHTLITDGMDAPVLGRNYSEAPWYFYPLTMVIKFTLPFLAMLAMGGAGIIAMGRERRTEMMFLLLPALLYVAASLFVRMTSGIWHLLPMFPFLIIAAAAGCAHLAQRYRWGVATLVCLLVLHAASSLHSYPNYLSYANEAWGGPQNLYNRLPWTDMGQTYWQVSKYMRQHPNRPCWVDSNFYVPAGKYQVPCVPMGGAVESDLPTRMKGIVFVSSAYLQVEGQADAPLASFYASEPKALLGGSAMLVYEGEFDTTVLAGRALDNKALRLLHSGDLTAALFLAAKAVEMAPSLARPHDHYCVALAMSGYLEQGRSECVVAQRLVAADPNDRQLAQDISSNLAVISQVLGVPTAGVR